MLKVSFYSYKGGAGRSTTAWNTIQRLVTLMKPNEKEPFVIVDTDTESAGSTFLYKAKDDFFKDEMKQSVQRRMTDSEETNYSEASDSEKEEFFNGMYPIGTFFGLPVEDEKAVLLIGANLDKESAREADVLGDNAGKASEQMKNFRRNITEACEDCGAKALFFDTPSGTQFLADKSIEQSEIIVCCMRPTSQFREGTRGRLINFIKTDIKSKKIGRRKYILTPTVVCVDAGQKFFLDGEDHVYPSHAKDIIKDELGPESIEGNDEIKQAYKENVLFDMLDPTPAEIKETGYNVKDDNELVFGIPEIKRFKWFEACLGKILADGGKLTPNDEMAVNRYEYLAQIILKYRKP